MVERIMVDGCPLCGASSGTGGAGRAPEINSIAFEPQCGNLDLTGEGEEYREVDWDIESRELHCENGHEEADIRNALEARTTVSR